MMIAAGKIVGGSLTMKVACPPLRNKTRQDYILAAIEEGRYIYERGWSRSNCRNQDEEAGWDEAQAAAALPPLQAVIDHAAELQELQDDMEDRLWHSRGEW